jgi:hypothetical protein
MTMLIHQSPKYRQTPLAADSSNFRVGAQATENTIPIAANDSTGFPRNFSKILRIDPQRFYNAVIEVANLLSLTVL